MSSEKFARQRDNLEVRIAKENIPSDRASDLRARLAEMQDRERTAALSQPGRSPRPKTAQERLIEFRNRARLRVEAISAAQREEQRHIQATRRVFQGEVVSYLPSLRVAWVRLPSGQQIIGRMLGRGAPVGSRVVITIPLGSAIATIQTPEPRC